MEEAALGVFQQVLDGPVLHEVQLTDKADVVGQAVRARPRHEDVEEVVATDGQKLHRVLTDHGRRAHRVVQQGQLLGERRTKDSECVQNTGM